MADNGAVIAVATLMLDEIDSVASSKAPTDLLPVAMLSVLLIPFIRENRDKVHHYVEETVPRYGFKQFRRFFRMSSTTFEHVLLRISRFQEMQSAADKQCHGRTAITNEKKLLMTLWYMGSQETIRAIGDRFDVSDSTFLKHTKAIMNCICSLPIVSFPSAQDQIAEIQYFADAGFPNTIGAIDASHVPIKAQADDQMSYYNRKGITSLILQAVCNGDMIFTDIYAGWPGKVHDARVLRNSPLFNEALNMCGPYHIIGDSAHPLAEWLMTPYRDNGHLSHEQRHYNYTHARARCIIERAFALLKGRFRRLKYTDANSIKLMVKILECGCYLHNICIYESDELAGMMNETFQVPCDEEPQHVGEEPADRNGAIKRIMITRQLQALQQNG